MAMSIPYEKTGRVNQKARTRSALVGAARELLADGVSPTVEQAADKAGISRTTAYRYFRNQRALLVATYPDLGTPSILEGDLSDDPQVRLGLALDHVLSRIVEYEAELRAQLRLSLEPLQDPRDLPLRQGRVIGWFEDALAPLRDRMSAAGIRRLAIAIRAGCGIEAFAWLTDVAGVSREDAVEIMRSSAMTILRSAIAEHRIRAAS